MIRTSGSSPANGALSTTSAPGSELLTIGRWRPRCGHASKPPAPANKSFAPRPPPLPGGRRPGHLFTSMGDLLTMRALADFAVRRRRWIFAFWGILLVVGGLLA